MALRRFFLTDEKRTLHIPIRDYSPDNFFYVSVYWNMEKQKEFLWGITDDKPDFYCPYSFNMECGNEIILSCTDSDVPDDIFDGIIVGGTAEKHPELYPDLFKEKNRQQVHFSPLRGWMNDPNGLVYIDGMYHMCFQHNSFGQNHGAVNVSWGLATSKDGVHFNQYPDAIMPWDTMTHIASGSAILDTENVLGKGKNTVIAVFTGLETCIQKKGRQSIGTRGQYLYYSTDGGFTFKSAFDYPIIRVPQGEAWRDPKILKLGNVFCIAVYERRNEKDGVSFYSSWDLKNWKHESFTDKLYECPDMFKIKCPDTGEYFWILYGNNNLYRIGKFENFEFTELYPGGYMDYGDDAHAGQTYNCTESDTERFHMSWICNGNMSWYYNENDRHGTGFSQSMSVMCKFSLRKTKKGYKLFRQPIDALNNLRTGEKREFSIASEGSFKAETPSDTEITFDKSKPFEILYDCVKIGYDPQTEIITFEKYGNVKKYEISADGKELNIRIIADTNSVELFVNGEISCTDTVEGDKVFRISGENSESFVKIYKMKSIYD